MIVFTHTTVHELIAAQEVWDLLCHPPKKPRLEQKMGWVVTATWLVHFGVTGEPSEGCTCLQNWLLVPLKAFSSLLFWEPLGSLHRKHLWMVDSTFSPLSLPVASDGTRTLPSASVVVAAESSPRHCACLLANPWGKNTYMSSAAGYTRCLLVNATPSPLTRSPALPTCCYGLGCLHVSVLLSISLDRCNVFFSSSLPLDLPPHCSQRDHSHSWSNAHILWPSVLGDQRTCTRTHRIGTSALQFPVCVHVGLWSTLLFLKQSPSLRAKSLFS